MWESEWGDVIQSGERRGVSAMRLLRIGERRGVSATCLERQPDVAAISIRLFPRRGYAPTLALARFAVTTRGRPARSLIVGPTVSSLRSANSPRTATSCV